MPHTFDTGATKAQRTLVREAVIAKLASLRRTATPPRYLTAIKSLPRPYRGEGDTDGMVMLAQAFQGQAPAAAVALGRKSYDPGGLETTDVLGGLEVAIYTVSKHARDLVDGRLAADVIANADLTRDPGIETILEHIEERLIGQNLGVAGVGDPVFSTEDEVATFEDMTVFEQRFTVRLERQINPLRGVTQLLISIQANSELDTIPDATPVFDPLVTTITNIPPEAP